MPNLSASVKKSSASRTLDLTLTALFTALIAMGGTILKIPLPPPIPPVTTQFLFTALAGLLLGKRLGTLSAALYVALGLIGLPIFTAGGGIGYVVMPTFGYLIGYIGCAFLVGLVREKCEKLPGGLKIGHLLLGCVLGIACVYLCGVTYLYLIYNLYIGTPMDVFSAIKSGMLVFITPDLLWCVFVACIGKRLLRLKRSIVKA